MKTLEHHLHAIAVGEHAPDVALPDARGWTLHLDDVLGAGPVIIWYASPRPNGEPDGQLTQLRAYQDQLEDRGACAIVVAPESVAGIGRLAEQVGGPFTFLSDADGTAATALGISRPDGAEAAVFILDRDGIVRWRSVAKHPADERHASRVVRALTSSGLALPGPSSVLTPLVALAAVAVVVGLGVLAAFANDQLVDWDEPVRNWIQDISWPGFDALMRFSTDFLGDRVVLAPITILLAAVAWHRCRQIAAVFLAALPVGLALEFLMKAVVQRPRPSGSGGLNASFPSGHVIAAVVFWGLLPPLIYVLTRSRWMWRASIPIVVLIVAAVGVSRAYLAAHWPSDAVGGVLTGAIVLLLAESALHSRVLECSGCPLHPLRYGRRTRA